MKEQSTRLASQWESLQCADASMSPDHHKRIMLPDGHPQAIRIVVECSTPKPLRHKDGSLQYVAPWLLSEPVS